MNSIPAGYQYLRRCRLVLGNEHGQALDLSDLHITFDIEQAQVGIPSSATIRAYNISEETQAKAQNEFDYVELSVGYGDDISVLFAGQIRQFNAGQHENATDTFMDFIVQDSDKAYNWAVVNQSLAAGSTKKDHLRVISEAFGKYGVTPGYQSTLSDQPLPRGKVFYGAARDHMRRLSDNAGADWAFANGKLNVIPVREALPGEAVVLTSKTGMIGLPTQTVDGIRVRCLIDPRIRFGGIVKLDNASIQTASINVEYSAINYTAGFDRDGLYKVYSINSRGDTRGSDWEQNLICIALSGNKPLSGAYINSVASPSNP